MSYRLLESVWTLTVVLVVAAIVYALVGCATQCAKPVVTLQRPVLPTVSADAIQCLSNETYGTLVDRELRLREYAEQCEAVVREVAQ